MTENASLNGGVEIVVTEDAAAEAEPKLSIDASRQFVHWLLEHRLYLAFTPSRPRSCSSSGEKPDGKHWVHASTFNRCMGLAGGGQSLWMRSARAEIVISNHGDGSFTQPAPNQMVPAARDIFGGESPSPPQEGLRQGDVAWVPA